MVVLAYTKDVVDEDGSAVGKADDVDKDFSLLYAEASFEDSFPAGR